MVLLEPPAGRAVFRLDFEPASTDIDENGHVSTVVYMRWAQGTRFDRFIRIDAADGAMCAQVKTTWRLIEQATGRPKRAPAWMMEMFA